jgi:TolA-binding protein
MNEPERLSLASEVELERLLLESGRASAPTAARRRAIAAATAALGASAAGSAAASGLAAKMGSIASLKAVAVIAVAGIGAMTGAVVVLDRHPDRETQRVSGTPAALTSVTRYVVKPGPDRLPILSSPAPVEVASAETRTLAAPSPAPSSPRFPAPIPGPDRSNETSVHAELAALERARSVLASGEAARALALLDSYRARFPRGSMVPEAAVLRIEALVGAGDLAAAQRAGDAFLADQPQSPYAAHIRSLIGGPNP